MPLILAIEPDRRQAAQLSVVVRKRVHAELILVDTTERALEAIGNRMPDLVLVPALLSPQDDAALAAALRVIAAAARVQMLTIPVLGGPRREAAVGGVLSALRRGKPKAAEPDGCDPAVFAEQIASYLERAAQERPKGAETGHEPADDWQPEIDIDSSDAIAAVQHASGAVEDALNQEWLDPEPDDAGVPGAPSAPDESVSFALEEAVRALYADAPRPAIDPAPVAAESPRRAAAAPVAAAREPRREEWTEVEELIAALQVLPLPVVEVTDLDAWMAPEHSQRWTEIAADEGEPAGSAAAPSGAKSDEWVALIESLRHDVERLRGERSEKPARKEAGAKAARAPKPIQDEWGFFDPEQCGFAALLAKLDEVTESDDEHVNR
jgi:hypothetical protein